MHRVVPILFFCSAAVAAERYTLQEDHATGGSSPLLLVLRDADAGVEAAIAPSEGGELSSLRVRHKGEWIELLYHGRDYTPRESWRGKAPFLWPATGRNFAPSTAPVPDTKEGSYEWNGERYPMPIHGFAKDLPWKVESRHAGVDGAAVVLSLSDTHRTRRWYPFGFRLTVEYRLAEGRLAMRYTTMPFGRRDHGRVTAWMEPERWHGWGPDGNLVPR